MNKLILLLSLTFSVTFGADLFDYLIPTFNGSINIRNGYDSNVLRLSQQEQQETAVDPRSLGSMSTFDSHYWRIGGSINANYRLSGRNQSLTFRWTPGYTNYTHSPEKKYSSSSFEVDYSWGSYRHLKFKITRLNDYHLRTYVNRDISSSLLANCNFSDADHSLQVTLPAIRRSYFAILSGFLQRYYELPFTEFDLNIYYGGIRFSQSLNRWLRYSAELKSGQADNISFKNTAQASQMDRSYRFIEFYFPVRMKNLIPYINETGISWRGENRYYLFEDISDPLHSGRSHFDLKTDVWLKKDISDNLAISWKLRYRFRNTRSDFDWVQELKSFTQIQTWFDLTWQPDF